jgi:L-fuconolactonase
MTVVDAHHHLWDPARRDYAWMTGDLAPLRRRFALEDLRAAAPDVEATVCVEAAMEEAETVELLALAEASHGLVVGVVGWTDLTAPAVAERIAALRERPGGGRLVGIRHHVQDEPDPEWLLRDDVLRGLRAVADAGLRFDLLVRPPQLAAARRAVELVDDLAVVLDHCGKPDVAAGAWEPWSADVARLAAIDRVHCKLSGLVTEARWDSWRAEDIEGYAERILELFGPERVMFGSDWPVCTLAASHAEVLELAQGFLTGLSAGERHAVLAGTARRFYGLRVPVARVQ